MTVTVTPTVEASNVPPRIRLNISASAGETATTAERLDPDGTLVPVRTYDGNPLPISGGTALIYDYEAPFGQLVSYSSLESPATVSAQVSVDASSVWLIHPGIPALSMPVDLYADAFTEETWGVRQAIVQPMGRANAWTASDGQRKAPTGSVTVAIESLSDLQALRDLLADVGTLLLNVPASFGYGVDTEYIAVGAATNRRRSDIGADPGRRVVLPYTVVDRPVGGSQAQRTWADIPAAYATWAAVKARYPTWAALLAGP